MVDTRTVTRTMLLAAALCALAARPALAGTD